MNVLCAGAGYVGAEVARLLALGGHRVWALRRRPVPIAPGVTTIAADLFRDAPLELPSEIDTIVYAVAPDGSSEAEYERAYVVGLERLLDSVRESGISLRRIVYTSSTAVYAQDDGSIVDETSAVTPTAGARFLLAGEGVVQALGCGVVVRFAGIYGPGRDRVIRMVRDGSARITSPSPLGNRIHRDDCAGSIVHLLGLTHPAPVYVGVDDAPAPLDEVYRWLARELGVSEPALGEADARGRSSTRKRCSNALLKASGYEFRYPTYREGYRALLTAPEP